MYQKIKDVFTKNLPWKAFSILMATLLWFIVMNINNPTEVKTFIFNLNSSNISEIKSDNVCVLNKDEIENTKIEIKLKATRPVLDELTKKFSKGEIRAYIETSIISKYPELQEQLEINLPIKTNLHTVPYPNNNFDIVSFTPSSVTVKLDAKTTIPKKVYYEYIGEKKSGYIISKPILSSEYIQVTGAKSILDTIENVVVRVDISNKISTFEEVVKPIAYSKDGEIIEDITFNINKIKVKVPINLKGQLKVNPPKLIGNLEEGVFIKSISYEPKYIQVIGNEKMLQNINSITLPDINISNLKESKEFIFKISDLINKYDFSLQNKDISDIKVYIQIDKTTTKKISIPSSKLSISGLNNKVLELPENFEIEVTSSENNIQNLDINSIKANVNIEGLGIGQHKVKVDIILPESVYLTSTPYINISIKENNLNVETSTLEEINKKLEE